MFVELPSPAAEDWSFPRSAAAVSVLLAYGQARGIPAARMLAGTGLRPPDLDSTADREVTAAQELRVVRTLRASLGEVGVEVGKQYNAATFGVFGYALLASRTVLDAAAVALRFIDLSFTFAIPHAEVVGAEMVVRVDGSALPVDVRRFLVERDTTAIQVVLDSLVPGGVGGSVAFESGDARFVFPADQLSRPLPDRSPERLALAARLCREVVDERRARSGLAQDVRILITQRLADGAPMGEIADALGLGERQLRRRLVAEGVGYQELLDEVRSSMAAALTRRRATLPVADLATRLGYGSAAAYLHARTRWSSPQKSSPVRHV